MITTSELISMIEDCQESESRLTQWEIDFIGSLSLQIREFELTEKQINTLTNIWERVS